MSRLSAVQKPHKRDSHPCNWSFRGRLHAKQSQIKRCHNPQIKGSLAEGRVLAMVRGVLLDPAKLRRHVDFYKEDARKAETRIEQELRSIDDQLRTVEQQKHRFVDVYASGDLSRDAYVRKNRELNAIVESLRTRSKDLEGSAASLGKRQVIDRTLVQFCSAARGPDSSCAPISSRSP
jgi:hypothetical protein